MSDKGRYSYRDSDQHHRDSDQHHRLHKSYHNGHHEDRHTHSSSSRNRDHHHRHQHHHHHHHHHHHRRHHYHHHPYRSSAKDEVMQRLSTILRKTIPDIKMVAGYSFLEEILGKPVPRWDRLAIGLDCDEVYPNIYIGNRGAAQNKEYLQRLGITHVLNTADGKSRDHVHTGSTFYTGTPIVYMGLDIVDVAEVRVDKFFERAAKFIHEGLEANGKVFVHCLMGMSRSSTMVIAYMMLKLGMSAETALTTVRKFRDCRPNHGFLRQLAHLDRNLSKDNENKVQENSNHKQTAEEHRAQTTAELQEKEIPPCAIETN